MTFTIQSLAEALGWSFAGDGAVRLGRAAPPDLAGPGDLAVALSPRFAEVLRAGAAEAAVVWHGADIAELGLKAAVIAPKSRLALSALSGALHEGEALPEGGVSDLAVVDQGATIGAGVRIGPFATIGPGAVIGEGSRIGARVTVAAGAVIGAGARVHDGAWIGPRVAAGAGLVVQPGAVIGADGFSFDTAGPNNAEMAKRTGGAEALTPYEDASWHKVESLGSVVLGMRVEIGANSTVDAGTLKPTRIGDGTKLDNLVHVGHNVEVGRDCLLCGMTGLAGSVVIGDRVVLAGQTGVGDNLSIGSDVVTGAGTMIRTNVPAGSVLLGYPAMAVPHARKLFRQLMAMGRDAAKAVPKPGPKG